MSDADDEKVLEQITVLLRARLKPIIGLELDHAALKGAIRQMKIEIFPLPRIVDVTTEGSVVHVRLELPFRFRLDGENVCPDCKGGCHNGSPDVGHPCRCPKNCA